MLEVREAVDRIHAGVRVLPGERAGLDDALHRVLARDVYAQVDVPAWDNAAMDGYAVRHEDVLGASDEKPIVLEVRETVVAGAEPPDVLRKGECVRIMTGAPVPPGCDTVIRVEDTDGGEQRVRISSSRDAGRNVRPRGQDLAAGDISVASGTRLRAAHLGLLAASGAGVVMVHREPRVLLLSSGNELVELDRFEAALSGRRIVSTNGYTLRALLRSAGAEVVDAGIVPDEPGAWAEAVREAGSYDLVLSTGGASVGAFDFARSAAEERGFELDFWRVKARPASQTAFARRGDSRWLILPGNPVSAMVGFELFARPLLRRLAGDPKPFRQPVAVEAGERMGTAGGATFLLRVKVDGGAQRVAGGSGALPVATLTGAQGTGLLGSMAAADALLILPEGTTELLPGSTASALMLEGGPFGEQFSLSADNC